MSLYLLFSTIWNLFTCSLPICLYADWAQMQYINNNPHNMNYSSFLTNYIHVSSSYKPTNTWTLDFNKFAGMNHTEFSKYNGYTPRYYPKPTKRLGLTKYPDSWDWRAKGIVGPIKDQQQCGSCWAFSAVGALESQIIKATGKNISLSEQDIVDCVKDIASPDGSSTCCDGCMGGEMYSVYQYLEHNQNGKDDTTAQYPYTAVDQDCSPIPSDISLRLKSYGVVAQDENDMASALYSFGPLSVGVDANMDWQLYQRGIYNPTEEECSSSPYEQDHGVIVVGYGSENGLDYWIIRNSWGEDWGEGGYMRLARGSNACGIANSAIYPILDTTTENIWTENQCLNSHPECPSEVCYTDCPCACFIASPVSPCLCSAATCSC